MKMPIRFSSGSASAASSVQPLVPGLIIGVLFMLIAAVSLSCNDDVFILWQIAENYTNSSAPLDSVASTLRVPERKNAAREGRMLIESATQSLAKAQSLLADPNLLAAADRVTLSISSTDSDLSNTGSEGTGHQLAQILARRMDALGLRTVIRVSRAEDLESALTLAETMLAAGSLSANQVGIGIDASLKSDTIAFEIFRSIDLVEVKERLP